MIDIVPPFALYTRLLQILFHKPGIRQNITLYLEADFSSCFNHLSGNLVECKQFDIDYLFSMFIDNIQQILISISQIVPTNDGDIFFVTSLIC